MLETVLSFPKYIILVREVPSALHTFLFFVGERYVVGKALQFLETFPRVKYTMYSIRSQFLW